MTDIIKSAQQRKLQGQQYRLGPQDPLERFVECWKSFAADFVDCGNPISNLECSLKASKLDLLFLRSETSLLSKVSMIYNIYTTTLVLVKKMAPMDSREAESIFLARGLGLNKKAAKSDCYGKGYDLLSNSSVREIMSQEDTDENTLKQEIAILHRDNRQGFIALLKKTGEPDDSVDNSVKRQAQKRKTISSPGDFMVSKRVRPLMSENYPDPTVLVPKKKQGILMERSARLQDKLVKLKELLKEEGITKLHIVPKIDQFAHKTAISIRNVYKFIEIPELGYENKTPVFCEVYFDDVWMSSSEAYAKRNQAMHEAYCNFTDILCSVSADLIAKCPRRWSVAMESMPDICNVVTKSQGQDNDCLLTTNLANMKQMMMSMPDVKFPVEKMVFMEHESDKNIENIFKSLELSATRNLVLLECELQRNAEGLFVCNISLQGKVMASRTHHAKNAAKRLASETVVNQLRKTNDYIYITLDYVGTTYDKDELFRLAQVKKNSGAVLPATYSTMVEKLRYRKPTENLTADDLKRWHEDNKNNIEQEEQPENKKLQPLLPYLMMVLYDIFDDYVDKLSLEDIIFDVKRLSRWHREIIAFCAHKMGMRLNTKVRGLDTGCLLRRSITAQETSKMLQIHDGQSGRYQLKKCHNTFSKEELEKFKEEYLAYYEERKQTRDLIEDATNLETDKEDGSSDLAAAIEASSNVKKTVVVKEEKKPSAWENNEPLNFKKPTPSPGSGSSVSRPASRGGSPANRGASRGAPQAGRGRGMSQGPPRGPGPMRGRGPVPLMAAGAGLRGGRPPFPRQPGPRGMGPPGQRMRGHF